MKHENLAKTILGYYGVYMHEFVGDKIVEAVLADQAEQPDERREYTIKPKPFERGDIVKVWNEGGKPKLREFVATSSSGLFETILRNITEWFDYCEHAEYMINGYPLKQFSKDGVNWKFAYWVSGSHDDGYQVQTINGKIKFYSYMKGVDDDN